MTWSPGTAGSESRPTPAVPSRLATAISVTLGALSLCAVVRLRMLSIKVTMAMPLLT